MKTWTSCILLLALACCTATRTTTIEEPSYERFQLAEKISKLKEYFFPPKEVEVPQGATP